MLRLHQTFGAHAGRVRDFSQDVIRIGRLPNNDFAFDPHADLDASGNHAELRREPRGWVLVDVGSRNGTLVHGQPVQTYLLTGGEEIEFGTGGPRVRVEIVDEPDRLAIAAETGPATPATSGIIGSASVAGRPQIEVPRTGPPPALPNVPEANREDARSEAEEAAPLSAVRTRRLWIAVIVLSALLFLSLCLVSALMAFLWVRSRSG